MTPDRTANLKSAFARVNNRGAYARERAMLQLLKLALAEIQHELDASGPDEVEQNPMLKDKQRFVDRAIARVKEWEK